MKKTLLFAALLTLVFTSCEKEPDLDTITETENQTAPPAEQGIASKILTKQRTDGYYGRYWTVYKKGGSSEITHSDQYSGGFQLSYTATENTVGGKGWDVGNNRTIGYNVGDAWGQREFIGVYGWTRNPDVEYYVVEYGRADVDNTKAGYLFVKDYESDGRIYSWYKRKVEAAPCALRNGDCNFWQYKSVRKYQKGLNRSDTINMGTHAYHWKNTPIGAGPLRGNGFGQYTQYQVFGIETAGNSANRSGGMNATVWEE